jgi:hypothetical protein
MYKERTVKKRGEFFNPYSHHPSKKKIVDILPSEIQELALMPCKNLYYPEMEHEIHNNYVQSFLLLISIGT